MDSAGLSTETLTFVFTDIEGSTRLLRRLGDRYAETLQAHDDIIRSSAEEAGGAAFGSEGDAQNLVFNDPVAAVRSTVAAQRALAAYAWPDDVSIQVRMGVHTGPVQRKGDRFVGMTLHETARVASAGHGGQVLLSEATLRLVGDQLPQGVATKDIGEHQLKDLEHPIRLTQLDIEGLQSTFPPLRTLGPVGARLPSQMTSFIARREVATALEMVRRSRLVTLTGPGGTGKTRLAVEVAEVVAPDFTDGTFFVGLDAVTDAHLVASEIASTLGLPAGADPPMDRLESYLLDKNALIVLDNMEQVIDASDDVARLLKGCPNVSFIVTSRIPLKIYGEHEFPVPALAVPESPPGSAEAAESFEAVRLFSARAAVARPDFALDDDNAAVVADIVARLDGLPLAIELAAARLRMLSVEALRSRLDDMLAVLSSGSRDKPGRQRTLHGAIKWSHDLLDEPDRHLFARLGVFAGSAALDQVEAVCGPSEEVGKDIFESLESLTEQSLLRSIAIAGEPRFAMLVTIREFSVEQLAESGETDLLRRRHAEAYLRLVESAEPELVGPDGPAWNDRLELEHDNLRAALDWIVANDEGDLGLRMISAIWRFWQVRGHLEEGADRIHSVLELPSIADQPAAVRSKAHAAAGGVAYWRSRIPAMHQHYTLALAYAREADDKQLLATALYNQGYGPSETARTQVDRYDQGQPYFEEALSLYRELDDRPGIASALWALSQSAMAKGDPETADRMGNEALVIARQLKDPFRIGWAAFTIGLNKLSAGRTDGVPANLSEALEIFVASDDVGGLTLTLFAAAMLARVQDEEAIAWRLVGAATKSRDDSGTELLDEDVSFGVWDPKALPETTEGARELESGRSMGADEAIDLARQVLAQS